MIGIVLGAGIGAAVVCGVASVLIRKYGDSKTKDDSINKEANGMELELGSVTFSAIHSPDNCGSEVSIDMVYGTMEPIHMQAGRGHRQHSPVSSPIAINGPADGYEVHDNPLVAKKKSSKTEKSTGVFATKKKTKKGAKKRSSRVEEGEVNGSEEYLGNEAATEGDAADDNAELAPRLASLMTEQARLLETDAIDEAYALKHDIEEIEMKLGLWSVSQLKERRASIVIARDQALADDDIDEAYHLKLECDEVDGYIERQRDILRRGGTGSEQERSQSVADRKRQAARAEGDRK